MVIDTKISSPVAAASEGVDDAVGLPKTQWFIAIVNHRSEKSVGEKLTKMGIENYVPVQETVRLWRNGKRKKIDKVVIPSVVFIKCTEQQRKEIVTLPFIFRFMTNKAGTSVNSLAKPLAVVPDVEIAKLKFMLCQSDIAVTVTDRPFKSGEKVRIVRGSLAGLEGEVIDLNSVNSEVVVALDYFGCARLTINTVNLAPLN